MNIDEYLRQVEEDERGDQEWMRPVQYAKHRGLYPQQIYAWMRKGIIEWKICDCGAKVIRVADVDELLRSKGKLQPEDDSGENEDDDAECEGS
ncbi:MAG: hypothetical protein ABSG46_20150 [Candidatus Binataceae bacterium]|jgi:hypothetical protein